MSWVLHLETELAEDESFDDPIGTDRDGRLHGRSHRLACAACKLLVACDLPMRLGRDVHCYDHASILL